MWTIWAEKVEGKGEDARPICDRYGSEAGLLAVFDGMGGAGSRRYALDGATFTGAWFASRAVKSALRVMFAQGMAEEKEAEEIFQAAEGAFGPILETLGHGLEAVPTGLKSKLFRPFPTTMAALYFSQTKTQTNASNIDIRTASAGDSRLYALHPIHGLQQLSRDHLQQDVNPFSALSQDLPLSNCIDATGQGRLQLHRHILPAGSLLLAATDGCFHYVQFPAQFEFFLLNTLHLATSPENWRTNLQQLLAGLSGDDISLALIDPTQRDFPTLQSAFSARRTHLQQHYIQPLGQATITDRQTLLKSLWQEYAPQYSAHIPPPFPLSPTENSIPQP
ncbi:MAG: protein phosphatase 2C domain-containing protein [Bacteroidota bacterium]